MAAQPQRRVRKRLVWFSPLFLVVALTPAFLQTQYTCNRSGDTRLSSLELEVQGVDRLAFDTAQRVYDLWLPDAATTATVRAVPMDPAARVTWYVPDGAGMLASGTIGVGGGEVTIDLPPDGYSLYIGVFPPGGATNTYIAAINPACSPGSPCSDGNECTGDFCDPSTDQCVLTPVADGVACDFGGLPGLCFAGVCEQDASCPVLTRVLVTPLQANVGDEINVSAEVSGVGPIDYLWTATTGSVIDPSLPTTAYLCEEVGQQDLTITISDGTGSCTDGNTVTVTCLGGGDGDPPALTEFDFEPQSLDVSSSPATTTCTARLVDDGVGTTNFSCKFRSPNRLQYPSCSTFSPISGDAFDGVWSCAVTIPQGAPAGTWETHEIFATDALGNHFFHVAGEMAALGFPTQLDVTYGQSTPSWGTAELIETDDLGDALRPDIAIDPNGNAVVVWGQWDAVRVNIWSRRYTPTGGWAAAELIETNDTNSAQGPRVAVDANGNAVAVWPQLDGIRQSIWSNRYTPTGGWGTAELIETDDTDTANDPQVAVDANGNAVAVWTQDGVRDNIWSNRYTPAGGWGTAELLESDNTGHAREPDVAMDPNGNAVAVWRQTDGVRYNAWSNRYAPGAGWGTAELIETDNASGADDPRVAIDPNGNALAVWSQAESLLTSIWSNRYTVAGGWSTAELIETVSVVGSAHSPDVAIDPNGNALAVWHESDGTRYNIWSNRYTATGGWRTAELIESDNMGSAFVARVAVDVNGNALVVWIQSDGVRDNVWSNRYTVIGGWGTAELIESNDEGGAGAPVVAVDASGRAVAVWEQWDGVRYNIWSNRFE